MIDELLQGYRGTALIVAGVRLGVFDALRSGPLAVAELAAALDVDCRGVRILCDALQAIGLLEKAGGGYRLVPAAAEELLDGGARSQRHMVLHVGRLYERWGQLAEVVRSGRPAPGSNAARSDEEAAAFARAMADIGRRSAATLAEMVDLSSARTALDAGGGPGVYAIELAARNPDLRVTVFDGEQTLKETRRNIARSGFGDRVDTLAGDLLNDPVGEGYDFILLSNVVHCLGPEQNGRLVARLAAALGPGGRLCIKDFVVDDARTGPEWGLIFAVNMLVGTEQGDSYGAGTVRGWMEAAGLCCVEQIGMTPHTSLMLGRRSG